MMKTSSGSRNFRIAASCRRPARKRSRSSLRRGTPGGCATSQPGASGCTTTTSRWLPDETLHAFDLARVICREVAAGCEKPASVVASAKTVAAVERLAKADRRLAATAAQWDADGWAAQHRGALTVTAATFDLRTGVGHPPDPRDYITKRTACRCAPAGTPHPLWTAFLERITDGNTELQGFLQRYIGYCCTGFTSEHVFVFAYGTGANGKSTFINTIAQIFGDYATVADMSTFIASKVERHPTDLAKLRGARLVVAQETQRGRRWDETKIKALTGGDKITARFMRQDFFDFVPTFKLFICRQPQAAARQRKRGHAPPPVAGAVHRADPAG